MPVTTQDCRQFIIDFQRRNPQIEETRYEDELDDEARAALLDPKNWKRQHKVKPHSQTDEHDPMKSYLVYEDGQPVNRHAEGQTRVDAGEIAWERRFDCQPFEGGIAYLILETHDGKLLFADYVGD